MSIKHFMWLCFSAPNVGVKCRCFALSILFCSEVFDHHRCVSMSYWHMHHVLGDRQLSETCVHCGESSASVVTLAHSSGDHWLCPKCTAALMSEGLWLGVVDSPRLTKHYRTDVSKALRAIAYRNACTGDAWDWHAGQIKRKSVSTCFQRC